MNVATLVINYSHAWVGIQWLIDTFIVNLCVLVAGKWFWREIIVKYWIFLIYWENSTKNVMKNIYFIHATNNTHVSISHIIATYILSAWKSLNSRHKLKKMDFSVIIRTLGKMNTLKWAFLEEPWMFQLLDGYQLMGIFKPYVIQWNGLV